ncbi:unknown_gene_10974 [Phodopus roborovskii]|uniref:Unknown_gene_10974 protein n=1 Tax=Phodopus roborovskii TaxID=109678 RepID=A0AAU9ZVE0_PHORO|nr:unknown_gene_10974 [Phodopus roborovskii]
MFHASAPLILSSVPPLPIPSLVTPYIELQGTWTGSPGRWCCWQCRCILQHLCTGCSSGSGRTHEHGCVPPCAHPESARRKGTASESEVMQRAGATRSGRVVGQEVVS